VRESDRILEDQEPIPTIIPIPTITASITDHDGRLHVTWPAGRGTTTVTPEFVEGLAQQINHLRQARADLRDVVAEILNTPGEVTDEQIAGWRRRAGLDDTQ